MHAFPILPSPGHHIYLLLYCRNVCVTMFVCLCVSEYLPCLSLYVYSSASARARDVSVRMYGVCACVFDSVRVRMCVCACLCVRISVCLCVRVCVNLVIIGKLLEFLKFQYFYSSHIILLKIIHTKYFCCLQLFHLPTVEHHYYVFPFLPFYSLYYCYIRSSHSFCFSFYSFIRLFVLFVRWFLLLHMQDVWTVKDTPNKP